MWKQALRWMLPCIGLPRTVHLVQEELAKNMEEDISHEYKISILPITPDYDIDNLYPLTDHVELWNTFVVGNDKTYILVSVNDPHIVVPCAEAMPNNKGQQLPDELHNVFDMLWTKTLRGKQLQLCMVWNSRRYLVNTYPFFNGMGKVIGAIMFMRAFDAARRSHSTERPRDAVRRSHSAERQRDAVRRSHSSERHPVPACQPQVRIG